MEIITKLMNLQIPAVPALISFTWLYCMLVVAYKMRHGKRQDLVKTSFILLLIFYAYIMHTYKLTEHEKYMYLLICIIVVNVCYKIKTR